MSAATVASMLPAAAPWTDAEHRKCVALLERLAFDTHQQQQQQQPHDAAIDDDDSDGHRAWLAALRATEESELRLIAAAVHGRDAIGLASLCSVFWTTRNAAVRDAATARRQAVTPSRAEAFAASVAEQRQRLGLAAAAGAATHRAESVLDDHVAALRSQSYELLAAFADRLQRQFQSLHAEMFAVATSIRSPQLRPEAFQSDDGGAEAVEHAARVAGIRHMAQAGLDADSRRAAEMSRCLQQLSALGTRSNNSSHRHRQSDAVGGAPKPCGEGSVRAVANRLLAAQSPALPSLLLTLPDGSSPWLLSRLVPCEAAAGESLRQVLARCSAAAASPLSLDSAATAGGCAALPIAPCHVFSAQTLRPVLETGRCGGGGRSSAAAAAALRPEDGEQHHFTRSTKLVAIVTTPLRGLREASERLRRTLASIQTQLLPSARARVVAAREELWAAEVSRIQSRSPATTTATPPLESINGASASAVADAVRQRLARAEGDVARLETTATRCTAQRDALEGGHFGALLSPLLETLDADTNGNGSNSNSGSNGFGGDVDGERIVFVCKTLPPGTTPAAFARGFGVPEDRVHFFSGSDNGSDRSTAAATTSTMAYVPVLRPRASLAALDGELAAEMDEHGRRFPAFPPNIDLLEHQAALRSGDAAALSVLLTALRRRLQGAEWDTGLALLRTAVAQAQALASAERLRADQLAADLERADAAHQEAAREAERLRQSLAAAAAAAASATNGPQRRVAELEAAVVGAERRAAECEARAAFLDDERRRALAERDDARADATRLCDVLAAAETERQGAAAAADVAAARRVGADEAHRAAVDDVRRQLREALAAAARNEAEARRARQEAAQAAASAQARARQLEEAEARHSKIATELQQQQQQQQLLSRGDGFLASDGTGGSELAEGAMREAFVAREIPSGSTAAELARSLGVPLARAVAVFDAAERRHLLYLPLPGTQLRASIAAEDAALRAAVDEARRALAADASPPPPLPPSSGRGAPPPPPPPLPSVQLEALLEQLAALRDGDAAAISAAALGLRRRLAAAEAALVDARHAAVERDAAAAAAAANAASASESGGAAPRAVRTFTSVSIDREDDDQCWHSPETARRKIALLRAALNRARQQVDEWRAVCDDYRRQGPAPSGDGALAADFRRRLHATELLLETRSMELGHAVAKAAALETQLAEAARRHGEEQRRTHREQEAALRELGERLREERAARAGAVASARTRDRAVIAELRAALAECGVEADEGGDADAASASASDS